MMTGPDQARLLLAEAVHCEATAIPDDVRIGGFAAWDSLAHLRLVLGIEQKIGRQLDADEAITIESLEDIAALLG